MDMFYYMIIWDTVVEATGAKKCIALWFLQIFAFFYVHMRTVIKTVAVGETGALGEKILEL